MRIDVASNGIAAGSVCYCLAHAAIWIGVAAAASCWLIMLLSAAATHDQQLLASPDSVRDLHNYMLLPTQLDPTHSLRLRCASASEQLLVAEQHQSVLPHQIAGHVQTGADMLLQHAVYCSI